jgi:hypothetical protein
MDAKKLLVGTLNGAVGMMLVAYVMWDVLLVNFFSQEMVNVEPLASPNVGLQFLSSGVSALLLTIVLSWKNPSGLQEAAKDAAIVGVLIWLGANFWNMGTYGMMTMQGALVDGFLTAIPFGFAGFAIFWTTMRGELQSGRIIGNDAFSSD